MKDYQKRMVKEYQELRECRDKLGRMLALYDEGTLEFELSCPVVLLETQLHIMIAYLNILEQRAEIEGIEL